ncbi:PREDICTED: junctional adhesion molecule-like [Elephantulus edwardii]|uniref:junctional adhesion molecule-like n=1 Tax=Elephantulus edwardii TaxID=28737 RepID=UPI0003F06AE2|nr:PREDICTED: junctional adhesion molecule-like [Elephantulus edwardii]
MLCSFKLILVSMLLVYSLGLNNLVVPTATLTVHVGDPVLMVCAFQTTEEKRMIKVDWMFSSKENAKDDYVLYYYSNLSVPVGRFINRVRLVGNGSRNDGSLLLQNAQEADQGTYTCEIRLEMESRVFKKEVVLNVIPEEPKELVVHEGDSIQMGCVFKRTEDKHVTMLEWVFSSGEHGKTEMVLHYSLQLSEAVGRFQNRVKLVGDISRNNGSIILQGVEESDSGNYTCTIHLGSLEFKKTILLRVILKEPRTLVTPAALTPDVLGGNQLVIIVGIVCSTILLLAVLILIMKRTHRNKSSENPTTLVKSLENTKKVMPEKHIYTSINTKEVTEEEESAGKSEPTYMTMHPVWPPVSGIQKKEEAGNAKPKISGTWADMCLRQHGGESAADPDLAGGRCPSVPPGTPVR